MKFVARAGTSLRLHEAFRTGPPIDYLRLVDPVARVVCGGQAGGVSCGAVDIDCFSAAAADQVMVVVTDPVLIERGGPGGLDAPDETLLDQHPEGIIDGLSRNGSDVRANLARDGVCGGVRKLGHRPDHGQTLGRNGNAVTAEGVGCFEHPFVVNLNLDPVKKLRALARESHANGFAEKRSAENGGPPATQPLPGSVHGGVHPRCKFCMSGFRWLSSDLVLPVPASVDGTMAKRAWILRLFSGEGVRPSHWPSVRLLPILVGVASGSLGDLRAATSSLDFATAEVGYAGSPSTRGYVFTVTSPVLVTGLSVYDHGADGLAEDHTVGLWDSGGQLLASAFVPKGTGSLLDSSGKFRFVPLGVPVTLSWGENYRVGATFAGSGPGGDAQFVNQTTTTMAGGMFFVHGAYVSQVAGLSFPGEHIASGLGGGSFVIEPVPEAGVAVLGSLGLLLLVVRRRHPALSLDRQAKKRTT